MLKQTIGNMPDFDTTVLETLFTVGHDLRRLNTEFFKGALKGVTLYSDVRTESEIASDVTAVDLNDDNLLASYSMTADDMGKDIKDNSANGIDLEYHKMWLTEQEMQQLRGDTSDRAYSMAVVGDTQKITIYDLNNSTTTLDTYYKWIANNKDALNIKYVLGLGDITDTNAQEEYTIAKNALKNLENVGLEYSLVRGNHDAGYHTTSFTIFDENFYNETETFTKQYITPDGYEAGIYKAGSLTNTWRTLKIGSTDWLMMTLDYGAPDDVLAWAGEVVAAHPNHKVIVSTHGYLYSGGKHWDSNDSSDAIDDHWKTYAGDTTTPYNNGDGIWEKFVSQYANIDLVLCGHIYYDDIEVTQRKGVHGNTVTEMLINPQGPDASMPATATTVHGLGAVAMLYFNEQGDTVDVEYYSVFKDRYFKSTNQFTVDLNSTDTVVEPETVYDGRAKKPMGQGTEQSPYLVNDAGHLLWMSEYIRNGTKKAADFDGVYFKQTSDIDLGGTAIKQIGYGFTSMTSMAAFGGVYDGQGYSIKNGTLETNYANKAFTRNYSYGLFGAIYGATVKNVVLDNVNIMGRGVTGGIVGIAAAPTDAAAACNFNVIENCKVKDNCRILTCLPKNATVNISVYDNDNRAGMVGGIVGMAQSTTIEKCVCESEIKVKGIFIHAGGIAAAAGLNSVVNNCAFTGGIEITDGTDVAQTCSVGGIVGFVTPLTGTTGKYSALAGYLHITNCYNNGYINYTGTAAFAKTLHRGGILGFGGTLKTAAAPSGSEYTYLIENCHNLYPITDNTNITTTATAGILGKGQKGQATTDILYIKDSTSVAVEYRPQAASHTNNNIYTTQNAGYVVVVSDSETPLEPLSPEQVKVYTNAIDNVIAQSLTKPCGSGTKEDPYIIDSVQALDWMSQSVVRGGTASFNGVYFKQTKDIDLADQSINPIGYYFLDETDMAAFGGIYDGQGYHIKNGIIDGANTTHEFKKYYGYGLFGVIYGGTVKNVVLDNIELKSHGVTGMIVGHAASVTDNTAKGGFNTIENCHVLGNCKLTATLPTGVESVTVGFDDDTRAGVTGSIVGVATAANISHCSSDLDIAVSLNFTHIGGIAATAGYNTKIDNCKFTGSINITDTAHAKTTGIGGIVGICAPGYDTSSGSIYYGCSGYLQITNCYNNADVNYSNEADITCSLHRGGIIGYCGNLTLIEKPENLDYSYLIDNCHNLYALKKNAYITSTASYISGIVGKGQANKSNYTEDVMYIRNSYTVEVEYQTNKTSTSQDKNVYNCQNAGCVLIVTDAQDNLTSGTDTAENIALKYTNAIDNAINTKLAENSTASLNNIAYTTVAAAVAAANENGGTVIVNRNSNENADIILGDGATLDLNGKELTVLSLTSLNGSQVKDSGEKAAKLLTENAAISSANELVPYIVSGGYSFAPVNMQAKRLTANEGEYKLAFKPIVSDIDLTSEIFGADIDDEYSLTAHITWDGSDTGVTASAGKDLLNKVFCETGINNKRAFTLTVRNYAGLTNVKVVINLTLNGVTKHSETFSIN